LCTRVQCSHRCHSSTADGRGRLALQAKTRQFMFDHVRRGLVEPYGLAHWWLDCDEP
jgi:hypothetical protein